MAQEAKDVAEMKKNRPKIQEVEPPAFKKVEIEEDSDEDSDDEGALKDSKAEAALKMKKKRSFDEETLQ